MMVECAVDQAMSNIVLGYNLRVMAYYIYLYTPAMRVASLAPHVHLKVLVAAQNSHPTRRSFSLDVSIYVHIYI